MVDLFCIEPHGRASDSVVRHRWGTTASTLVHAIVNLTSVVLLVILGGGR